MLPSIWTVPVSRHLKQTKRSILNESWTFQLYNESVGEFKACKTVTEEAVLFRWVNFSWLIFMLLRKGWVMYDIFKETVLYCVRFSERLLILLEIRFVWNNGGQKHSLGIDVRCPVFRQFFFPIQNRWISCVHYPGKLYFISITIIKA